MPAPGNARAGAGLAEWLLARRRGKGQRPQPRLKLVETLPLGGRRYIALVECDGQPFLLGGAATSVDCVSPLAGRAEGPPAAIAAHTGEMQPATDKQVRTATTNAQVRWRDWLAGTLTLRVRHVGRSSRCARNGLESAEAPFSQFFTQHVANTAAPVIADAKDAAPPRILLTVCDEEPDGDGSVEREFVAWAASQTRAMPDRQEGR